MSNAPNEKKRTKRFYTATIKTKLNKLDTLDFQEMLEKISGGADIESVWKTKRYQDVIRAIIENMREVEFS